MHKCVRRLTDKQLEPTSVRLPVDIIIIVECDNNLTSDFKALPIPLLSCVHRSDDSLNRVPVCWYTREYGYDQLETAIYMNDNHWIGNPPFLDAQPPPHRC